MLVALICTLQSCYYCYALLALLSVYLIDAVNGGTIYRTIHRGGSDPADIVLCENWIVVSPCIQWRHEGEGFIGRQKLCELTNCKFDNLKSCTLEKKMS